MERALDDVIEQATEAAMDGSGHDELDAAVYRYLRACGDDEIADDMLERNAKLDAAESPPPPNEAEELTAQPSGLRLGDEVSETPEAGGRP